MHRKGVGYTIGVGEWKMQAMPDLPDVERDLVSKCMLQGVHCCWQIEILLKCITSKVGEAKIRSISAWRGVEVTDEDSLAGSGQIEAEATFTDLYIKRCVL